MLRPQCYRDVKVAIQTLRSGGNDTAYCLNCLSFYLGFKSSLLLFYGNVIMVYMVFEAVLHTQGVKNTL